MALAMSRPWRDPDTGIWYLRKRVPKDLVAVVGKTVHKLSLKTKVSSEAKHRHVKALADLEARWASLRAGPRSLTEREAHSLAAAVYTDWIARHRENPSFQLLWHPELFSTLWTAVPLPEIEPQPGIPGEAPITNVFYRTMRRMSFEKADNLAAERGLVIDDWERQKLAKAVAAALQRASLDLARQAEGRFGPADMPLSGPADPAIRLNIAAASVRPTDGHRVGKPTEKSTINAIVEGWWNEAKATGLKPSTYESYRNSARLFIRFLGHDDASQVSPENVIAFKQHRLATPSERTGKVPSAKTVKDSDLAALKALFAWAVANRKLLSNPAAGVTIKLAKPLRLRGKGFTDPEAVAILKAALNYVNSNERPSTSAAKRWVPWLCAFTGARVGEIAQLRRRDVRRDGDHWVIHITPEAGTQKTNEARDVPLHPQLASLGFPAFVEKCPEGPLFLTPAEDGDVLGPLQGLKNRLAEFGRSIVPDVGVQPNHGWRHRFATVALEAEIEARVLHAIQGHAARSVADSYGVVSLKARIAAIAKLPSFDRRALGLRESAGEATQEASST